MLTKEEALWADHMLSTDAAGLRKRAVALRSQGRRHLPLKKATTYVAEACDKAAIELERARKQINQRSDDMIFDDDFVQLELPNKRGTLRVACQKLGITDWPPPEMIAITGGPFSSPIYKRVSFSPITDKQREKLTRVCRGALYRHDHEEPAMTGPGAGKTAVFKGRDRG